MTVQELIDQLKTLPGDREIYVSRDSEGNGFNPLYGINKEGIMSDDGDIYEVDCNADDVGMSEKEWKKIKETCPRVVVIWP